MAAASPESLRLQRLQLVLQKALDMSKESMQADSILPLFETLTSDRPQVITFLGF